MWMKHSSFQILAILLSISAIQMAGCTGSIADQEAFEGSSLVELDDAPASILDHDAQQIRYGAEDGDAHPSVVKLIMRVGGGYSLCSGSVIHESAVLTAAHCIDSVSSASDVMVIIDNVSYPAAEMVMHPEYDASTPHVRFAEGDYYRFSGADIAVLKFDEVLPVPTVSLGDLPSQRGEQLTIVGFGNNENQENGIRRNGTVEYIAAVPTYLKTERILIKTRSIIIDPGPTDQTVCRGDSGGALLYNGELVGVTSGGVVNYGSGNLLCSLPQRQLYFCSCLWIADCSTR